MSTLLQIGLANAVCAALLAVPAVVASRRRRPALAHGLWLLVLIKLVTPPLFPVTLPWLPPDAPPLTPTAPAGDAAALNETWAIRVAAPAPSAVAPDDAPPAGAVPFAVKIAPAAEAPAPAEPVHAAAPAAQPADWTGILAAVWIAGAWIWFVRAGVLLVRFRRLLRFAKPAPESLQEEARRLAAEMGLRRAPAVWLLPGPIPPMVWAALGSARVYFPAGLLGRLGDDERAALLAHELAHVRRGDHWVRRLELVVGGLYWWYPLTWWARRRMQAHEEECCDAWAAAVTPARAYAEAILKAVDFLAGAARTPVLVSGLGRARDLKRRLTLILCGSAPRRLTAVGRLGLLAGAALALPLGPVLSQAQPPAAPTPPAAKPAAAPPAAERKDEVPLAPQAMTLLGGNNEVFSLAVSPDGGTLAAAVGYWDRPGQIAVWDLGARRIVRTLPTPLGSASVVFSPDGRRVGAAGYDAHGYVWDLSTGRPQFSLTLDGPGRLAFSPDGKFIATATEAKTVKLWDGASGKEVAALQGDLLRFHCVTFSRDGTRLAAGGGDWDGRGPSQVTLWDVNTQKQIGKLPTDKPVLAVAFSPDSAAVATGDVSNAVKVWDAAAMKVKAAFQGHQGWVEGLAFSPDGKLLASAGHDSTARVWDLTRGGAILSLVGNAGPVRAVAFTPDGKTLVTGGGDRTVRLWDAATGTEVATLLQEGAADEAPALLAVAFSPDGKTLALAAGDGTVQLRDASSGELRRTIQAHGDRVTCLAFSPDGKRLATGSPDKTVRLWDAGSGEQLRVFEGHTGWVHAVAFSPDGKQLASGGYDRTVRLWDAEAGKEIHVLTGHKAAVRGVAFAPDGKTLASAGADGVVRLWNTSDFSEKNTLKGHEAAVRAVAFAPDGKLLASASEDGTARIWTADGKETAVLKGHGGAVVAVAFSPQGTTLATGGADAVVRLWDPATGAASGTLTGCSDAITSLAFAADGRLAAACRDKTVKVWKPANK